MGRTAVKLTSLFGNAVRPEAAPDAASSTTHKIDSYEIQKCLGTGGMGTVYRARDEKLDRVVALKVMLKDLRSDPAILEAFRKEARAVAKLNHPNIAQIYSFGENEGKPYIAMEYVGGEHFDSLVFSPAPLDQAKVMKTGMEIAQGLQVAADAGLVHGDIKPENIVFDDHGVPKLLDFGIASASNAKSTEIWGTPYYIAPEKLRKERVDFRSDIYCLGATLYHALTKHPPFDGDDVRAVLRARLDGPPPQMSTYRPDIDPEVEAIVGRMLQADPSDRYPTYGALIADIRAYLRRVDPKSVQMDEMFADEEKSKKPRTPFFQDIRSQIMLLLVLVAMFPYVVFFYVKPMLFPRGYQPPFNPQNPQKIEGQVAEDQKGQEEYDKANAVADDGSEIVDTPEPEPGDEPDDTAQPPPETQETAAPPETPESSGTQAGEPVAAPAPEMQPRPPTAANASGEREADPSAPQNAADDHPPAAPADEVIDLTVDNVEKNAAPVKWPQIKVAAIIGGGEEGGALVNGGILPIGQRLDNGALLISVEPQSATFEYQGQTKKFFVRGAKKAPQKPDPKKK